MFGSAKSEVMRRQSASCGIVALLVCGAVAAQGDTRYTYAQFWRTDQPRLVTEETRALDFSQPSAYAFLGEGWRYARGDVYTFGPGPSLASTSLISEVHVCVFRPRDLRLRLFLKQHHDDALPAQEIQVAWNRTRIGVCAFQKEDGWKEREFAFDVPASAMESGWNTITLINRFCVAPKDINRGNDPRPLAFGIRRLELTETETAPPPPPEAVLRVEGETLVQLPNSRAAFPCRLPGLGPALLSFQAMTPEPAAHARVLVRWDAQDGPKERVLFEIPAEIPADPAEGIALDGLDGKVVEIIFEAFSDAAPEAVRWTSPQLCGPAAPQPESMASPVSFAPLDHVILIILDALRADRVGCMGWVRDTTPCIDALASRGVLFERVYAAAPYTFSSTFSLLTGMYPFQHGASQLPQRPADALPRLPGVLREHGIVTGCISANRYVSPESGMSEGFDEFFDGTEGLPEARIAGNEEALKGDPGKTTALAQDFLRRHAGERSFLYVHYRQPHAPYFAPGEYAESLALDPVKAVSPDVAVLGAVNQRRRAVTPLELENVKARYEENLRAVDAEVGKLWRTVEELQLTGRTVFIVMADHGEAFLEHGQMGHSNTVYEEETHIPLVVVAPNLREALGASTDRIAGTVDLFPAICRLLGAAAPAGLMGRDLFSADPPVPECEVLAASQNDQHVLPWEAYWFARYKLVTNRFRHGVALYDLELDPGERSDLAPFQPVLADYLRAEASAWRSRHELPAELQAVEGAPIDDEMKAQLEALGYVH
ncbi:MAG: sulfatase [Candidatus Hydrogenedentes bacterium]|nr:sulfatase [Candidatus Hydrogenedentota bacterium]